MLLCRICLAKDVRMCSAVDKSLHDVYQNLTMMPFERENVRPTVVCYICHARLQGCYRLKMMCLQSEQWFAEILNNNEMQPDIVQSIPRMQLTCHALINLSNIPEALMNLDLVKKEPMESLYEEKLKQENFEDPLFQIGNESPKDTILRDIIPEKIGQTLEAVERIALTKCKRKSNKKRNLKKKKSFKCIECNQYYSSKSSLQRHNLTHSNKKIYQCDICEKKISSKINLITHIRVHTGERPFKCDVCNKSFTLEKNLKRHFLTHTGEKPYQCGLCEKGFSVRYNLECHLRRIHTGEKPFKCDRCNDSFYVKTEMLSHMLIHNVGERYNCDLCGKCFIYKSSLIKHRRVHSRVKYQCDICNLCFTNKSNFTLHMRKNHSKKNTKETKNNKT